MYFFLLPYGLSIINRRKLMQFMTFIYWPESLRQGGIMAAWVCTKEGRKMESEKKERKWKHVCKRTHQSDEMATVRTTRPNHRHTRLLFFFFNQSVKNGSTKQNFLKKQIEIFRYQRVRDNSVFPPKWIFPSGFGDKIRLQNGFSLRVNASVSPSVSLLTMTPHHIVSPPPQLG